MTSEEAKQILQDNFEYGRVYKEYTIGIYNGFYDSVEDYSI